MVWALCAFASGLIAAAIAILMKLYLKNINPFFISFVFAAISVGFFSAVDTATHKVGILSLFSLPLHDLLWIAIIGTLSWLAYIAYITGLQYGKPEAVVAVDRLGIVYVLILSTLFLEERLRLLPVIGAGLMVIGATLMSLKKKNVQTIEKKEAPLLKVSKYRTLQLLGSYIRGFRMIWLLCALISGLSAAVLAILIKANLQHLNPLLTAFATSVTSLALCISVDLFTKKVGIHSLFSFSAHDLKWLTLAGILGAIASAAYMVALQQGKPGPVVAIDRLGIVYVLILSVIFLEETFTFKSVTGSLLMVAGAALMSIS